MCSEVIQERVLTQVIMEMFCLYIFLLKNPRVFLKPKCTNFADAFVVSFVCV